MPKQFPTDEPRSETPLESWKEVAAYLKRDVRTAKRWEAGEGLPVRRHMHQMRASVYAYPSELDAWIASRQPAAEPVSADRNPRWRRMAGLAAAIGLAVISVGSNPMSTQAAESTSALDVTVRKVWAAANSDATGAPSPDGRYLSFANWAPAGNLGLHDLSTQTNRDLTNEGSWDVNRFAYYSIWSADAKQVAYFWMNGDHSEVRIVGLEGGPPRVLYVNTEKGNFGIRPMSWSADGKYIAGHLERSDATNQIVLISTETGAVRVLKSIEWRFPSALSFSPDGRWLALDAQDTLEARARDIVLLATDGARDIPLVKHPANDYGPIFTYDGRHVLFVSNRSGSNGLWSVGVSDREFQPVPQLLKADVGRMSPLGLTRDGKLYVGYASGQNAGDIYTVSLDPTAGRVIGAPSLAIQTFEGHNTSPVFSPDGKQMAYLSRRAAGWSLVLHPLDTGKEQAVKTDLGSIENPRGSSLRWSPNGRSILLAGVEAKGRRGLYLVDLASGGSQLVAEHSFPVEMHPAWAPNGETIYMIRLDADQKGRSLVEHRLRTRQNRVLHQAEWISALAVSPDGKRLAFFDSEGTGEQRLAVIKELSVGGGQLRTLLRVPAANINTYASITWADDGRSLLFTRNVGKPASDLLAGSESVELWRLPLTGGEPVKLGLEAEGLRNLALAPGGRRLAFTGGRPVRSEVWVIEDFLPRAPGGR